MSSSELLDDGFQKLGMEMVDNSCMHRPRVITF